MVTFFVVAVVVVVLLVLSLWSDLFVVLRERVIETLVTVFCLKV